MQRELGDRGGPAQSPQTFSIDWRLSACKQFQQVTIGVVKVHATAAFSGIQLAVRRVPGIAAPSDARLLHAPEDRIEFVIADVKRIVMRLEGFGGIKVQCQLLVDVHRCEMTHRPIVTETKNSREETRRSVLILCRYNRVI